MKVLIYGANGWIGTQFVKLLQNENIQYISGLSRVDDDITLNEEIIQNSPTHIISFIGRTHGKIGNKLYNTIDYLEQEGKLVENIRDNLYSPLILAEISKKLNLTRYRRHPDPWGTNYNSVDNFILAMYSKSKVTRMIKRSKIDFDYIVFLRPDVRYLDDLKNDFFNKSKKK